MAAPTQAILTTFNKNTIITFYRRKITTLTIIMYIISEKKKILFSAVTLFTFRKLT